MTEGKGWIIFAIAVWAAAVGIAFVVGSVPAGIAVIAVGALVARYATFLPPRRRLNTATKSPPAHTCRLLKPAAEAAGLPEDFRPYDLRHTCASLMLHAGIPATDSLPSIWVTRWKPS